MRKHMKKIWALTLMIMLLGVLLALGSPSSFATFNVPAKMAWWYEARFGMFIHFGSYSYLGHGEWAMAQEGWSRQNYQTQVSANFNPTNFNAATIANYAKSAGMKYLVITAKHHEGFAMWNSPVASFKDYTGTKLYNLYNFTAFKRDALMELKTACEAAGIKFCLYYSILDWNHPSQTGFNFTAMTSMTARTNYINDMKAHLQELITKYNPAVLWFDGDWTGNSGSPTLNSWWTKADGIDLYNYLMGLNPNLIINERVCRGMGIGDFTCPEQTVPGSPESRQWETCQTMNGAWGYNASSESSYRSASSLVQELVTVVARDGNYLLNIGPAGDGSMTPGSQTALSGMGSWMTTYSDSIYGTTGTPFMTSGSFNEPGWGKYTKKSGKLFCHVFYWGSTLQVQGISNAITKIYMLNNPGTTLSYTVSGGNINISMPGTAPNSIDSVVVIECSGVPTAGTPGSTPTPTRGATPTPTIQATPTPTQTVTPTPSSRITSTPTPTLSGTTNLALNKTASADSQQTSNTAANGNDGNTSSRWCANDANLNHWWKVDLGQNYNLTGSEVTWESAANYKYRIETSTDNSAWTVASDKTASTSTAQVQSDSFTASARYVRITVTGMASGRWASFFEFKVFGSGGGATSTPTIRVTPTVTRANTPTPTRGATVTATPTPTQRGATATPTPTRANTPTPTGTTGGYGVTYTISSDWGSGGNVDVSIKNNTSTAVNGWTLNWTFPGAQTITNMWNATYTQSGASVSVKDAGYNATIGANGGTASLGFGMNYSGTNAKPTAFTLNGTACTVQ